MSEDRRIHEHPVLPVEAGETVKFYWNGQPLSGKRGEALSSALIAAGIDAFGRNAHDHASQGIFCANGQCSKCLVIADHRPVKSCMTPLAAGMKVNAADELPALPEIGAAPEIREIPELHTDVLIIGAGPAGLSAAVELGRLGVATLLVDDKHEPGGKLVLQTHKFFGSVEDSQAGTRGIRIGRKLAEAVAADPRVTVWPDSTVLYVYSDRKVGVLRQGAYRLVVPKVVLNAAGAREKSLVFPGNHLIGVYGAGAFQTLVNRDLVRPSSRLFIVGGGNVGLIAGYHAIQAGITVVGLAEALPACGGYKVHADKLKRLGVPVYTSHTVLSANGSERVESVTIAKVDERFRPLAGTERTFACDTLLVAVGLDPIAEFTAQAEAAGLPVFAAGDAAEIAEASSAMFNGRIAGLAVARALGATAGEVPAAWKDKAELLKSHPGKVEPQVFPEGEEGVMPVIHCLQEIPCNPCSTICPTNSIQLENDPLLGLPRYKGRCIGCAKCLLICPGLAITLVDYRRDRENPIVTVPYEMSHVPLAVGGKVQAVDIDGNPLGEFEVAAVQQNRENLTRLVRLRVPRALAKRVVAFRVQAAADSQPLPTTVAAADGDHAAMACLCERVSAAEVRRLIRSGITDINQIKAVTRAGMGACGGKSCDTLIRSIFRQEGIDPGRIVPGTRRPLFVEVPLGTLAGSGGEGQGE
ncbi:MAG: FAD-dependent oxidoreductase [Acidobacteria bacterium]|jgi:NADPH-dependent 2,4-dienoyl-CoA reductase/sulfur reductase-like enzyme/Pyruvate/2-oxoacid:ferredoxin oxidoreductase delta subunit/bacterioferritin-associated ferredoxin|nr:FAD-dependent oxidoreductase [Acidobacteriota bacterium]